MFKQRFYMSETDRSVMAQGVAHVRQFKKLPECHSYARGTLVPAQRFAVNKVPFLGHEIPLVFNLGGVFDSNMQFAAGYRVLSKDYDLQVMAADSSLHAGKITHTRLAYCQSYAAAPPHCCCDETVVFLGDFHYHFGHTLQDTMSRMWYAVRHSNQPYRYVMFYNPHWGGYWNNNYDLHQRELVELLGIPDERLTVLQEATRFQSVIVPDQCVYWGDGLYCRELLAEVYERIRAAVQPGTVRRIYLSRRKWFNAPFAGEEWFEQFFAAHGYKVIYPELLPLREQLALISGAEVIACTLGTLSHLALFAREGTRLINLWREPEQYTLRQLMVDDLRGLDSVYIDTTLPEAPDRPAGSLRRYPIGPTPYWEAFLDQEAAAL